MEPGLRDPYLAYLGTFEKPSQIMERLPTFEEKEFHHIVNSELPFEFWNALAKKHFNENLVILEDEEPVISYLRILTERGGVDYGSEKFTSLIHASRRALRDGDMELFRYFFNQEASLNNVRIAQQILNRYALERYDEIVNLLEENKIKETVKMVFGWTYLGFSGNIDTLKAVDYHRRSSVNTIGISGTIFGDRLESFKQFSQEEHEDMKNNVDMAVMNDSINVLRYLASQDGRFKDSYFIYSLLAAAKRERSSRVASYLLQLLHTDP